MRPGADDDFVAAWRGSAAFRDGVARIRASLETFEPHTMDPVVTIEPDGAAHVRP